MNTTKSVYNKLFKEEATELASQKVELASLDMVIAMFKDAQSIYKRGQDYAKEMEAFTKKSNVLHSDAFSMNKGLRSELIELEKQAKQLGLDVKSNPEYKRALDILGPLENVIAMTDKFRK